MVLTAENNKSTGASTGRRFSLVSLVVLCVFSAVALAVAVRLNHPTAVRQVVARVASADASVVAVVYEQPADAKSSFLYQVEVMANGQSQTVAELSGATRNDRAYGLTPVWSSNDNLSIEYLRAQNQRLLANDVSIGGRRVHVALHSGVRDNDAPAGGMLFNLQQSREPGGF
jgi:asparagine N-glycosylation enzyme membrane subunit Stt3